MKTVVSIIVMLAININSLMAVYVCQPAYGGGWTCFGSNGSCATTFSSCTCSPSSCEGGAGSSSGCNTCCCNATAIKATNNNLASMIISAESQLVLTLPNESTVNLGNISQLSLGSGEVFQYSLDLVNEKVIFKKYDFNLLSRQVGESGYITNLQAAQAGTVTLDY